jgi:hypothetical protein
MVADAPIVELALKVIQAAPTSVSQAYYGQQKSRGAFSPWLLNRPQNAGNL